MKIPCSCLLRTKKKNVCRKTGNGKAIVGSKRYVDIFVKYVECLLAQDNSTQAGKLLPLNLMCQEEHLKHFSFSE